MSVITIFVLLSSIIGISVAPPGYENVDCITVRSPSPWATGERRISCGDAGSAYSNYVVTGCGYTNPWSGQIKSYIDSTTNECVQVSSGASGPSGSGSIAVAQCCDLNSYNLRCSATNRITAGGGSPLVTGSTATTLTAKCPKKQEVIGCVSIGENCVDTNNCDTSPTGPITNQICTAYKQQNTGSDGVEVQAVCCKDVKKKRLECQQIVGSGSGPANDAISTISCKTELGPDYFLTSCGSYCDGSTSTPRLDGQYARSGDECVAHNSGYNGQVFAVAQCCRLESVAEDEDAEFISYNSKHNLLNMDYYTADGMMSNGSLFIFIVIIMSICLYKYCAGNKVNKSSSYGKENVSYGTV